MKFTSSTTPLTTFSYSSCVSNESTNLLFYFTNKSVFFLVQDIPVQRMKNHYELRTLRQGQTAGYVEPLIIPQLNLGSYRDPQTPRLLIAGRTPSGTRKKNEARL